MVGHRCLRETVSSGGHICLYSDAVILTSASTQITNAEYFRTSGPLVALPFAIATVGFIALGFVCVFIKKPDRTDNYF